MQPPCAATAVPRFEDRAHVVVCRVAGGCQPGADARGDRDRKQEGEHPQVGCDVESGGRPCDAREHRQQPERDHQPRCAAEQPEREAFGEQLPDHAGARRAERDPDPELAAAGDAVRQQQVGHVDTRQRQQQSHRDHHDHQSGDDGGALRARHGRFGGRQQHAGGGP